MEINYYLNLASFGEITTFLNANYNKENKLPKVALKEYLLALSSQEKILKVFRMLGIEEQVLEKHVNDLLSLEEKLIILATQLLKGKEVILNYFEKGLNEKERIYIKRILRKLALDYKVKVLVFTNDLEFLLGFVDKIIILENQEIAKTLTNKEFYNESIFKYIDRPQIISFVKKCHLLGKKLDNYIDISELLKGLYRL
ncbi:MAG: hypothetical protein IJA94_04930 [Bacilli bacterium]|nr:hypothetical protein [Bacilli bacterium]